MSKLPAHPSQKQLSAYNLGQLPPDEAVAIESHISECEPCCDTIVSLSTDDTFVSLLKEARQLPTDQTVDHGVATVPSSCQEVPAQLAEHPRYEVTELIGKGGMGDVYKARHRMMKRTVALKIIKPELVRKPAAVDRFHREVTTAAQLSHPNIVTAYDAEQAGEVHFLVMEYVDGVDLSHIIKDRGPLPIADACAYIRQAAIGLQYAHERGMVHRDIKPHNLMVMADGTVKILDFGLASLAPEAVSDDDTVEARGDLTAAGTVMGTPDFISPEQAEDARRADIRSDIYSLGASLYFLLSGRPLFADGSVMHKLKSHAQAEPEPLESLRDDVPSELVAVVTKMTAKDPEKRFQTPGEVADALECLATETQPTESTKPKLQVTPGRRKPRFLPFTVIAALFVGIVCATTVFYLQTDHGTVRVEVMDPSLAVRFDEQTIRVDDGEKEFTIGAGEQRKLVVTLDDSGVKLVTESFQISRGDEIAFKVRMLRGEIVVRKDDEPFDRVPLDNARTAAHKAASVSNLRQIGMAFIMFEQDHGYLPSVTTQLPGAKHPVSWRVAILKYLDEDLYNQYKLDEPWYSDHNKTLLEKMPSFYRHPGQKEGITNTCYVTLVGENTATGNGETLLTDSDAAKTILVTEAYTNVPWTKPEDLLVDDETLLPDRRPHHDGWNVVFVDGSAHFIASETSADVLRAVGTRNGSEQIENVNGVWKKKGKTNGNTTRGADAAELANGRGEDGVSGALSGLVGRSVAGGSKGSYYYPNLKSITQIESGKVRITYTTMPETVWFCPGANAKVTEQGCELTFVRAWYKQRPKVQYPASKTGDPKSIERVIVVDSKGKPIFIRSGETRKQIWDTTTDNNQFEELLKEMRSEDAPRSSD